MASFRGESKTFEMALASGRRNLLWRGSWRGDIQVHLILHAVFSLDLFSEVLRHATVLKSFSVLACRMHQGGIYMYMYNGFDANYWA